MPVPNNESNNLKFTDGQTQAVEETKLRLLNLEGEISIGNKNLKNIKLDTEKAIKEKLYQDELSVKVNAQVEEANTRLSTLFASVLSGNNSLSEINQEIAKQKDILNAKDTEYKEREENISSKETELVARETSVSLREENVKRSEELLADKYAKVKNFAKTI